ncbi:hypothetical protein C1H46_043702 [Malus baccata]|uniref:Uncharacterized protein n=1 Tax=Malus baccata TaxID=106549 RepID=A0A540K966_MALBA|nr:hypothetical protein C1H46_043702 [Malus baccata]
MMPADRSGNDEEGINVNVDVNMRAGVWRSRTGEGGTNVEGRQRHASQFSLSNGILPSLGATARNRPKHKLHRFIISPFNYYYK